MAQAEFQDIDDCAKMFLCQLNPKNENELGSFETFFKSQFGMNESGVLDVTKLSVRFDLAAVIGQDVGMEQCQNVYGRCKMDYVDMLKIMESSMPENDAQNLTVEEVEMS